MALAQKGLQSGLTKKENHTHQKYLRKLLQKWTTRCLKSPKWVLYLADIPPDGPSDLGQLKPALTETSALWTEVNQASVTCCEEC